MPSNYLCRYCEKDFNDIRIADYHENTEHADLRAKDLEKINKKRLKRGLIPLDTLDRDIMGVHEL